MVQDWISGYKIPFDSSPYQQCPPKERIWSSSELQEVQELLSQLQGKGAIEVCESTPDQFISDIFLVPKPDGSSRLILNLKSLNRFITTEHFKLEDLRTARDLMFPDCRMATLDLKDAYYLVPIDKSSRKYLRFRFQGVLFEFTCLPFGLSTAPYVFTKIMKPVVSHLRSQGIQSVIYLDDLFLIGKSHQECQSFVNQTLNLLVKLGFIINYKKSSLSPSTQCKFLGFILDSRRMLITLPVDKKKQVKKMINKFMSINSCRIRELASFIGTLGSCCSAVRYGWVYLKDVEREKFLALEKTRGNFEAKMILSDLLREDLEWWVSNIDSEGNPINDFTYEMEIHSDASLSGWGACFEGKRVHGFWGPEDQRNHINYLELLSAFFGLKCFARDLRSCNILLRIDNTTAISYINHMGGIQIRNLSKLAKEIWQWCESRNLWIFASYVSSSDNNIADHESRRLEPEWEFGLAPFAFSKICRLFSNPEIDLFASRSNKKCEKFISWKNDPESVAIDAFTVNWSNLFFYAFPPFSIILRVLKKIRTDGARGIVVVPQWQSQPWFPLFMEMLESEPVIFQPNINLINSLNRQTHPLWKQLSLVAGVLSGRRSN